MQEHAVSLITDGLSPSSVRNHINAARVLFRRAVTKGELGVSPCANLELPAVDVGKRRDDRWGARRQRDPAIHAGFGSTITAGVGFEPTRRLTAPSGFQDRASLARIRGLRTVRASVWASRPSRRVETFQAVSRSS